jgi:hypothetical protein
MASAAILFFDRRLRVLLPFLGRFIGHPSKGDQWIGGHPAQKSQIGYNVGSALAVQQ